MNPPFISPGGKLVYQYVKKASSPAICGVSGVKLNGVSDHAAYRLVRG